MPPPARPAGMRTRVALVALAASVLAACAAEPQPSVELIAVPTQSPGPFLDLGPSGCPGALLEGTLVRHDEAGVAVEMDPNLPPAVVVWPHGWSARDVDGLRELLDDGGRAVAREGDRMSAGGGFYPPRDWFTPCGDITFTTGS